MASPDASAEVTPGPGHSRESPALVVDGPTTVRGPVVKYPSTAGPRQRLERGPGRVLAPVVGDPPPPSAT